MRNSYVMKDVTVIAIMLGAAIAVIPRTAFMLGSNLAAGDGKLVFLPYLKFAAEAFRNFTYPLWTTLVQNGFPIHGDGLLGFFYPDALLLFLFPPYVMWNLSVVFHLFLAGLATYFFCKRIGQTRCAALVAGLVFLLSSHKAGYAMQGLSSLRSGALLPVILLLTELYLTSKRVYYGLAIGVLMGFQILAGHPFPAVMTFYAFILYFVLRAYHLYRGEKEAVLSAYLRRNVGVLLGIGAIALGVSAVQLLPMLELADFSVRGGGMSYRYASAGSLLPLNLVSVLFPHWAIMQETPLYIGIVTLMFVLFSLFIAVPRHRGNAVYEKHAGNAPFYCRCFLLLAGVSLFLALGRYNLIDPVLRSVLPGLKYLRMSERFLLITSFSLAVLAGFGLDYLLFSLRGHSLRAGRIYRWFAGIGFASLFGILAANICIEFYEKEIIAFGKDYVDKHIYNQPPHRYTLDYYHKKVEGLFERFSGALSWKNPGNAFSFLFIFACAITLMQLQRHNRFDRRTPLFLVFITCLDLLLFSHRRSVDAAQNRVSPAVTDTEVFLGKQGGFFRVYRIVGEDYDPNFSDDHDSYLDIPENYNMVSGIRSVGINSGLAVKRFREFLGPLDGTLNSGYGWGPLKTGQVLENLGILSSLSVRYILSSREIQHPDLKLVHNGKVRIYENPNALPRAFVVHRYRDDVDALAVIHSEAFRPGEEVLLSKTPEFPSAQGLKSVGSEDISTASVVSEGENRVALHVEMAGAGFLVLNDLNYPGWRAFVDGEAVEILEANYMMRALALGKGFHRVEFTYDPPAFRTGVAITIFTLGLCIPGLLYLKFRHKRR